MHCKVQIKHTVKCLLIAAAIRYLILRPIIAAAIIRHFRTLYCLLAWIMVQILLPRHRISARRAYQLKFLDRLFTTERIGSLEGESNMTTNVTI